MNAARQNAILVVDDDALLSLALRMELQRRYGKTCLVEMACSAPGAEKLIDELSESGVGPFLVISDWMMPGMRGDAFLERLHERHPEAKTILLSGYACDDCVSHLYSENCLDAFIAKPWSPLALYPTIDRLLSAP